MISKLINILFTILIHIPCLFGLSLFITDKRASNLHTEIIRSDRLLFGFFFPFFTICLLHNHPRGVIKCSSSCKLRKDKSELFGFPCDSCKQVICRNCAGLSASEIRCLPMSPRVLLFWFPDGTGDLRGLKIKLGLLHLRSRILRK